MRDVHLLEVAAKQFNRVSRPQLHGLGFSEDTIERRLAQGRLVIAERGVLALPPLLEHDDWGRWSGATLTSHGSRLSHVSAAAAYGFWTRARAFETVTRPGSGGPRRHGGVLVFRSSTAEADATTLRGIPIMSVERTLLDLAAHLSARALARAVREGIRMKLTTAHGIADTLGRHRGRRGARRLADVLARYAGLPLARARSGAEVHALEILRDAGRQLPSLNVRVAGEEADLSWPAARLILEIDGGPFHLDVGEDLRKQSRWEAAGWTVRRMAADDISRRPDLLLSLAATPNVPLPPA